MGIAQRQVSVKFAQKSKKQKCAKAMETNANTVGDWIKIKRLAKNLTLSHVAVKMGIATALVRSWEDDNSQPNEQQLEVLAKILGCKAHLV